MVGCAGYGRVRVHIVRHAPAPPLSASTWVFCMRHPIQLETNREDERVHRPRESRRPLLRKPLCFEDPGPKRRICCRGSRFLPWTRNLLFSMQNQCASRPALEQIGGPSTPARSFRSIESLCRCANDHRCFPITRPVPGFGRQGAVLPHIQSDVGSRQPEQGQLERALFASWILFSGGDRDLSGSGSHGDRDASRKVNLFWAQKPCRPRELNWRRLGRTFDRSQQRF
ncbi:hypothetical protein C8R47DRAFT_492897 [Mycena vitilis]|nr:hypothetical protein C8R47DRAFT_492897 [Mycena vitilis]